MNLYRITFSNFPFPFFDYFETARKAKKWAKQQKHGKSKIRKVVNLS